MRSFYHYNLENNIFQNKTEWNLHLLKTYFGSFGKYVRRVNPRFIRQDSTAVVFFVMSSQKFSEEKIQFNSL